MVFKRHTSPLHFEPLSPPRSELLSEFSDSDDGLHKAARNAKRRKIERLGQDYLEGKPLFILSASLKGPLDNGWINPWRRKKEKVKSAPSGAGGGELNKGIPGPPGVIPEQTSKHFNSTTKTPRVRLKGSGFEPFLNPERIQEQRSNGLQWDADKRTRERLETAVACIQARKGRQSASNNILSGPRTVSAPLNSVTAERATRPASASHRISVDSKSSWLKTDANTLHAQAYGRPIGSSPTPGYRPRSSGKSQSDGGARQQSNTMQRVDDLADDNGNNTSYCISFTPINGPGPAKGQREGSNSSLRKTGNEPPSEKPSSSKTLMSPDDRSRFPKPGKPASAFRRHSSGKEKEELPLLVGKNGCRTLPTIQPSESPQAAPSTDRFPGSQFPPLGKPLSSADTISSSNGNAKRHKHCHSENSRSTTIAQPEFKDRNRHNDSSHTLPFDPTPSSGTYNFRDQTFNNSTASGSVAFAQIIPDHWRFSNPVISLHSAHLSAIHDTSTRRGSQSGGYEDQRLTQAGLAVAQKPLRDGLAVAVDGDQSQPLDIFDTVTQNGQTHNHDHGSSAQAMPNAVIPFDFNTAKRIKPGGRPEGGAYGSDKRKGDKNRRRNRSRNRHSEPPSDPFSLSHTRNQTQSLPLFPDSTPRHHQHDHSLNNGSHPPGERNTPDPESTSLPFNLNASTNATNSTRQQQDGQGHPPGWDNFNLSQAVRDAGTFLASWDFENAELERLKNIHNSNSGSKNGMLMPLPSTSSGPKLKSILRSNMSAQ
ncbi:hypothetical protein AJ78_02932 [Emergomyces pasteurianus Ep9510]|uniref:Uncharacterized protein n=1 Tax=Emergomyces pasteurianus Ep9510 TaxID=1447872 RepID=A0A1J9PLH0_9EURO|nr:hypothetical protein AJ78_02932 [Emergomyces pasteurianus Ep9510]